MSSIKGTVQAHDVTGMTLGRTTVHQYESGEKFTSRDLVIEYADGSTFVVKCFGSVDGFDCGVDHSYVDTTSDAYRRWLDGETDDKPVAVRGRVG